MITHIRHTGIVVSDLDAALRFYGEFLGFVTKKRMDESGAYINNMLGLDNVKVTTVKMAAPDGNLIELLYFHSHTQKPKGKRDASEIGVSHIALTVKDMDQTYAKLTALGVAFNAPPQLSPDGYAKVTFCRDPDGSLIELVQIL